MIGFSKIVGRHYLDSINALFRKLYQKLDPQNSNNKIVNKSRGSAKETYYRMVILLIPIGIISFLISFLSGWEIQLYNSIGYSFSIYIALTILIFFGFILIGGNSNPKLIRKYKLAAEKWNKLNLSKSEKKKAIQTYFLNKYKRNLRYGEIKRIKNNAEKDISFRYGNYLRNDRILFLKLFFYGPLLNNLDDNVIFSKLAKVFVGYTVFLLGPIIYSLSYLFQEELVNTLYWYITRGITYPLENNREKGEVKQKILEEKDLVIYKSNGQVHKWTDRSKNFILNKYDECISDSKLGLSPKECRKKARDKFSDKFSHILKRDSEPTLKTIWEWIEY